VTSAHGTHTAERAAADTVRPLALCDVDMHEPQITLYRLQACPFCERVVRLLDAYDLSYRSRYVEPMHSARNVVKRVSGARSVPAIVDRETGVTMSESGNIVEYLERTYGSAAADGGS
jgi:glutathione S-transferase